MNRNDRPYNTRYGLLVKENLFSLLAVVLLQHAALSVWKEK